MVEMALSDSGARREFSTGSVRDAQTGKGRFDLAFTCYDATLGLARLMEAGCQKYGERNWELGQPVATLWDSAMRHACKYAAGYRDEPHGLQWLWNVWCLVQTEARIARGELPATLWNLPAPRPIAEKPPTEYTGLTAERLAELFFENSSANGGQF